MIFRFIALVSDRNKGEKLRASLRTHGYAQLVFCCQTDLYKELRLYPSVIKIIFVDFDSISFSGEAFVKDIKSLYKDCRIIGFRKQWLEKQLKEMFQMRVFGLCSWHSSVEDIRVVINSVLNGSRYISRDLMDKTINMINKGDSGHSLRMNGSMNVLSAQEQRILQFIIMGMNLNEVSDSLDIRYETTRSHLKNIYKKLGVSSMVQAVIKAVKENPTIIN